MNPSDAWSARAGAFAVPVDTVVRRPALACRIGAAATPPGEYGVHRQSIDIDVVAVDRVAAGRSQDVAGKDTEPQLVVGHDVVDGVVPRGMPSNPISSASTA